MHSLRVRIWEVVNGKPKLTVTHIFHGETRQEAQALEKSHRKTDSFYRAAIDSGQFNGIKLLARARWV